LRARVGEAFTVQPEVSSGRLDRETGWRFPGGAQQRLRRYRVRDRGKYMENFPQCNKEILL
jgi:hypothetical protein